MNVKHFYCCKKTIKAKLTYWDLSKDFSTGLRLVERSLDL